jgi:predicted nucleic acid-binding protein
VTERYLLDRDVLQALENPNGNRHVRAWAETVNDDALFLSVITVMEARKGFASARLRVSEPRARLPRNSMRVSLQALNTESTKDHEAARSE